MTGVERRRLCCTVLFHCAAAICVIWSLCVLIERAAEEVKRGQIGEKDVAPFHVVHMLIYSIHIDHDRSN